ncbi:DUF6624 domain-containing protein [uncultured Kordia sp.]|uniref:DUF6624 domain-containing protein n=1 Tax=uncultured Kordia sp. TaxID=507699 RepID=UPI00261E1F99|nr:DUF6624 domain-containing protein [uncultured Kordia sp.]
MKQLLFITIIISSITMQSQTQIQAKPIDYKLLKAQLETIRIEDQTLRQLLPEAEAKFGRNSDELAYIWKLIHEQDSINEKKVLHIIDTYGWLSKNKVGEMANQTLWLVVQHAEIDTQEKYLPYLVTSVNNNESDGWYLAFLKDRILMRNGKKQHYGTQVKKDKKSGFTYIYPIANAHKVNERRRAIGLNSIEEYAKTNNYVLHK